MKNVKAFGRVCVVQCAFIFSELLNDKTCIAYQSILYWIFDGEKLCIINRHLFANNESVIYIRVTTIDEEKRETEEMD